MKKRTKVALVKGEDPTVSVNEAVRLLGGIERYVNQGDLVLIKPNMCLPTLPEINMTTDPGVIKAIVELCKEAGARRIIIGDTPMIGYAGRECFKASGFQAIAEETDVETLDFHDDYWIEVKIPNGNGTKRVSVAQTVLACDALINVPKMKAHPATMVTLSLKNFMGLMSGRDKFEVIHGAPDHDSLATCKPGGPPYGRLGLEYALVDIHRVVKTTLNIIDGINGPTTAAWGGHPGFHPELIVAGTDSVATDTVATMAMGLNPEHVNMIQIADEVGIGTAKLSEIDVVGTSLEEIKGEFTVPPGFSVTKAPEYAEPNLHLIQGEACNLCLSSVRYPFGRITGATGGRITAKDFEEMTIVVGKDGVIPTDYKGKLILFGNCAVRQYAEKHPFENALPVPGCSPAGGSLWWMWKRGKIKTVTDVVGQDSL